MIEITEKKNCCGCGACVSACPVGCITMERDEEGFSYPKVDKEKCINCGKCERVCPVLTVDRGEEIREKVYPDPCALGGWNRDEKIREASSSGGAFSLFAEEILKEGGVVFGARYRDHRVTHVAVTDSEGLAALRGSKYVQSEIGDCYQRRRNIWIRDGRCSSRVPPVRRRGSGPSSGSRIRTSGWWTLSVTEFPLPWCSKSIFAAWRRRAAQRSRHSVSGKRIRAGSPPAFSWERRSPCPTER